MRIAYVCADPGVPVFGSKGASIHVQEVVRVLQDRGARVELFATRMGGQAPPDLAGVPVRQLPPAGWGELAARERAALAANRDLRAALRRAGPYDLVYERYSLWSFAGMEYARTTGSPGLLEVNAPLLEEQARHRGLVDRAGAERVAIRAFEAATLLLAVSGDVAAYLESYPATWGRVQVVPNGVNPRRFRPGLAPAWPGNQDEFTVGFVGSLKPWHGLETLVEAFAALHAAEPNVRLLIVGDGPQRASLEADLAVRGLLAATHFSGAVDPGQVPAWLASMDVAVAPYPDIPRFYFSPLKVFEYMAAGVPVVASRIGQLAQVIEDGVTGLLCPPGDPEALAAALGRLRAGPELRHRLGRAARATVLRHHTWDAVAGRILKMAGVEVPS